MMLSRAGLLTTHKQFFVGYRQRFVDIFVKVCQVLAPDYKDGVALREASSEFYDRIFIDDPDHPMPALEGRIVDLEEAGVNVPVILSKSFAVMTRDFVNYAVKTGDVVSPVHGLTDLMQGAMGLFDGPGYALEGGEESPTDSTIVRLLREHSDEPLAVEAPYQGVPMSHEVVLLDAPPGTGTVTFHLAEAQRVDLFDYNLVVRISAAFLPRPLEAVVVAVDQRQQDVTVGALHFSDHVVHPRSAIRVQPRHPIEVAVKGHDRTMKGTIADLSLSGISVTFEHPPALTEEAWVQVHFLLPQPELDEPVTIESRAEVVSLQERNGTTRCGLRLLPSVQAEAYISEYITYRQSEVIRQVQPELHDTTHLRIPAEKTWDLRGVIALTIVTLLLTVAGVVVYYGGKSEKSTLAWEKTGDWMAKSRECAALADRYQKERTPENLAKVEFCNRELQNLGGKLQVE